MPDDSGLFLAVVQALVNVSDAEHRSKIFCRAFCKKAKIQRSLRLRELIKKENFFHPFCPREALRKKRCCKVFELARPCSVFAVKASHFNILIFISYARRNWCGCWSWFRLFRWSDWCRWWCPCWWFARSLGK
ncbi:MAG: hypothetical protein [Microviridae sp.]|nr:MAG: hypothetical protein [Microviridae sp.]